MTKVLCLIDTLSLGGGAERQMAGLAGLLHAKESMLLWLHITNIKVMMQFTKDMV